MMVLKMLEDGKITAAQAAELLGALSAEAKPGPVTAEGPLPGQLRQAVREAERKARQLVKDEARLATRAVSESMRGPMFRNHYRNGARAARYSHSELSTDAGVDARMRELSGEFGAAPPTVSIQNNNGRIEIMPSDSAQWRLELKGKHHANWQDESANGLDELTRVMATENVLNIESRKLFGQTRAVDIKLWLPVRPDLNLNVSGTNGSVTVADLEGDNWLLKTVNGKVVVEGVTAHKLDLGSVNGRIAAECQAQELQARTANGSINVSLLRPENVSLDLHTVNGSIEVELSTGEGVGHYIDVSTVTGKVELDLLGLVEHWKERTRAGHVRSVKAGTPGWNEQPIVQKVLAQTVSGSVRVN